MSRKSRDRKGKTPQRPIRTRRRRAVKRHPRLKRRLLSGRKPRIPINRRKQFKTRRLISDPSSENAYRLLRVGNSQRQAAKIAGVSVKRFRRFIQQNRLASYRARRWRFTDKRRRQIVAITTRGEKTFVVRGFNAASLGMSHRNAVKQFLETNEPELLEPFKGKSITDTQGRTHQLETRPNVIYRLAHAGNEQFEQIYKLLN